MYKTILQLGQYIALAGLLLFSADSRAERWYEIEIILFEQATEGRLNSESWEQLPPLPDVSTTRDFLTLTTTERPITQLCVDGRLVNVSNQLEVEVLPEEVITEQLPLNQEIDLLAAISEQMPVEEIKELELPFQLLDRDDRELNDVYAQLRRRRGYRMLFHEAWRQPMARKRDSLPIRIYAGQDFSQQFNYAGDAIVELAESDTEKVQTFGYLTELNPLAYQQETTQRRFNPDQIINPMMDIDTVFRRTIADDARDSLSDCAQMDQEIVQELRPPVWQIDGYIRLYAERFRHIETNLVLRIPGQEEVDLRALATNLAADEMLASMDINQPVVEDSILNWQFGDDFLNPSDDPETLTRDILKYYSFQQSRRIIDSKVHYFDHPLIGMIVQMRAYDPEQEENDS